MPSTLAVSASIVQTTAPLNSKMAPSGIIQQEAFRNFVSHALDQLSIQANVEPLALLVSGLVASKDYAQVQILLSMLSCHISKLDSVNCNAVVKNILALDWTKHRHGPFMNIYIKFMTVLVSGIPRWWPDVADKVVADFVYADCSAHHTMLQHVLRIIPTATPTLHRTLAKHLPHKADTPRRTLNYVKNMLALAAYCPSLQRAVWGLIFERLVQLDVELLDEEEGDENDDDEDEDYDVEEDEDEDEDEDDDFEEDSDEEMEDDEELPDGEDEYLEELNLKLHKNLDQLMCLVMTHLDTLDLQDLATLFPILIDQFQNYILPTHRTRSAQFVMFHVCGRDPAFTDQFLIRLIELALASDESPERRHKTMQYIASFVARFGSLSRPQIVFIVSFLAQWVGRYISEREVEVDLSHGSMGRFRMFYAVSQALFYIFCFRHSLLRVQDSVGDKDDSRWESDINLLFQRMIVTRFNPLRYCKQTVVTMFAQVAQRESAAYCFTMLKQNKSGVSRESGALTAWVKSRDFVALEGYFPFDPLNLKRARRFVSKNYVEWADTLDSDASDSDASASDSDSDMDSDMDSD